MPIIFVFLWASAAFIIKAGLQYAEPMTFLSMRLFIASALVLGIALVMRTPLVFSWKTFIRSSVTGIFIQVTYLVGFFTALTHGISPGLLTLILGAQPIVSGLISSTIFKERINAYQWIGLVVGLIGLSFVVLHSLFSNTTSWMGVFWSVIALLGITLGTIFQKRLCGQIDLSTNIFIQYFVSAVILLVLAYFFDSMKVQWTGMFIFSLGWTAAIVSVAATYILYTLVKKGRVIQVTSWLYTIPAIVASVDYFLFDQLLSPVAIGGMIVIICSLVLVNGYYERFKKFFPARWFSFSRG
ncbi:MAG: DMT family transporter [Proteobacteria bacterium]|nr:DMT family transporter [Pseudomonadota bacterium]